MYDAFREIAEIAAGHFDHFICRRDDNLRGRGPDEVPELMKSALLESGVKKDAISIIPEESEAVDRALAMAEAGDLLLIFGDDIARTWKQIIYFNRPPEAAAEQAVAELEAPPVQPVLGQEKAADPLAEATPVPDAPKLPEAVTLQGMRLVRDERGVRLANEEEAD